MYQSTHKDNHIKTRGTSSQVDRHYKSFMLCLIEMICTPIPNPVYTISYVIYNVSHTYAVQYNISSLTSGATVVGYTQLSQITTVYTVFAMIGWIFTNVNTYKYEIWFLLNFIFHKHNRNQLSIIYKTVRKRMSRSIDLNLIAIDI